VYDRARPAALEHLLLVGTFDVIPIKPRQDVYPRIRSYTWYGMLDGDDYVPDVGVGIIPAKDETELSAVVNKTIRYHERSTPGDWWRRVALVAATSPVEEFMTDLEAARTQVYSLGGPVFDTIYGDRGATNSDLVAAFNSGRSIVSYHGHGNTYSWGGWSGLGESFTLAQLDQLTNQQMHPVVLSASCDTLDMGSGWRTVGEHFVMRETGAVAFAGALGMTNIRFNARRSKRFMAAIWSEDLASIGEALMYSNLGLAEAVGGTQRTEGTDYLGYHWIGDPSLYSGPNPDPGGEAPLADNGEPCTRAQACSSGHCVNGVCCESACAEACMACNGSGQEGRCIEDPLANAGCGDDDPCTVDACVPGQGCQYTADPDCNSDPEDPPPGAADGAACDSASDCASGYCVSGVCCDSACDGACLVCNVPIRLGRCVYNPELDLLCEDNDPCTIDRCEPNVGCVSIEDPSCSDDPDPEDPPPGAANGAACESASDCASGYCVSNVCCDSACDGACIACDLPASLGQCLHNPELDLLCQDKDPCTIDRCEPNVGCVSTEDPSCSDDPDPEDPPPGAENGAACTSASDCASGFCVSNVCCDSACDGACIACDLPASLGQCIHSPQQDLLCQDKDPCTIDQCVPNIGCVQSPNPSCSNVSSGEAESVSALETAGTKEQSNTVVGWSAVGCQATRGTLVSWLLLLPWAAGMVRRHRRRS
jgi:hypothetical protein